jgi:hypothetical protein
MVQMRRRDEVWRRRRAPACFERPRPREARAVVESARDGRFQAMILRGKKPGMLSGEAASPR